MVWHPMRAFADMVIDEMAMFPRGKHDDLTDVMTQGLWWLRQGGWLERREEREHADKQFRQQQQNLRKELPLYPV
jgi:hypothetical protein